MPFHQGVMVRDEDFRYFKWRRMMSSFAEPATNGSSVKQDDLYSYITVSMQFLKAFNGLLTSIVYNDCLPPPTPSITTLGHFSPKALLGLENFEIDETHLASKLIVIDHVLKMPLRMTQQAMEMTMETEKKMALWVNPYMFSSWKSTDPNQRWIIL
ncbi:hypothetical protein L1887_20295 [Cichorium endivia]|nr:hypothetical protein L1887_20295 [Cichorium endivia]